jgi:hypothetical protein
LYYCIDAIDAIVNTIDAIDGIDGIDDMYTYGIDGNSIEYY